MRVCFFTSILALLAETASAAVVSLKEINLPAADTNRIVAIVGARLIDGKGGAPVSNAVVVVRGAKIAAAGSRKSAKIPVGAEVFNATGKTLLPGFIDSHFHIERDYDLPALVLSRGVTSLRDPGQWIEIYDPIRRSEMPQPRCFVAGPHLDCPPHAQPQDAFAVTNADETRRAVNRFVDEGASVIKVYYRLPLELIGVACEAAHQRGVPVPQQYDEALRAHQVRNQTEDGYLGDHVASAFHLAHYFRLVGQPTPKAKQMVARVLRDQKPDGGWNIKEPSWDVHACFDAVFILRQLGGDSEPTRRAIEKAADWVLTCRNADDGFGHYPKWHSDMDAVYFQFGTLIQAGRVPSAKRDLVDAQTMSWGHAMQPGKIY